jgi:hypothetical protein
LEELNSNLDIDGTSVPDIHNMSLEDSFDFTPLNYDDDEDDNNERLLNNLNFIKVQPTCTFDSPSTTSNWAR